MESPPVENRIIRPPEAQERYRRLNPFWWSVVLVFAVLALLLTISQIFYLRIFGFMPAANGYYYYLLGFFLPLVYIIFPASSSAPSHKVPWYDCFLFLLCFVTLFFFAINAYDIVHGGWDLTPQYGPVAAVIFSFIIWGLVLEAMRRAGGWALFVVCAVISIYPLFAGYLPGILEAVNFPIINAATFHAMTSESLVGIPTRTLADLIIGYMVFGVALQRTGGGRFFLNFSMAVLGHARGGPGKVAVVSSGLYGMLSGSAISNVLTTGSVTIPTMKRAGFSPEYAAAIEAVAATGGCLMPPVMGAVAFIMASFLGVPYSTIVIAATVPSILYYAGLFVQVDGYAARTGLKGVPRSELPSIWTTLKEGWFYIFALLFLVYFLLYLRLEAQAPFYATALLLALAMIRKDTRFTFKSFLEFIAAVGMFLGELAGVLGGIGLVLGALAMTGVAPVFSGELILLAGGSVILLLLLGAIASTILGMGLTISACYIFLAIILGPALVKVGINPIAAHLFILYWGLASFLTPPVALSAITAASLAGANPMKVGLLACRLAVVLFVVPFFFAFNPALLLIGPPLEIIESVLGALVGIGLLAYALVGYLPKVGSLGPIMRVMVSFCGLLLALPAWYSHLAGLAMLAMLFLYVFGRRFVSTRIPHTGQE